jgi:hypothetical protein
MMAFSYDTMPASIATLSHSFLPHFYIPLIALYLRSFIPPLVFVRRLDSLRVGVSGIVLEFVAYARC